jgi:hypothetical protein
MAWPMPSRERLQNIIYHSSGGFRGFGTPLQRLIISAKVAQGIVVLNRARQEVSTFPGWGWGHGTEHETPPAHPDPELLRECWVCSGEAISIFSLLPADEISTRTNMFGAQLFCHSVSPPGNHWQSNRDTRLVASYGSMLSPEQMQRRSHGPTRGYLGIYVNLRWLGRALAAKQGHRTPHQVNERDMLRCVDDVTNSINWAAQVQRYSS